jgi:hypothetical protein
MPDRAGSRIGSGPRSTGLREAGLSLTAEAEVILLCSRTQADQPTLDRLGFLLEREMDWACLLREAASHGVMPLLHSTLSKIGMRGVPREIAETMKAHVRANVFHAFLLSNECVRLTKAFEAAGVAVVPFKGPVLAASAYGDATLRQYGDLDLFVRRRDVRAALSLMLSMGYRFTARMPDPDDDRDDVAFAHPYYYVFVHGDGRRQVDLQWRMSHTNFGFSLDHEELWGGLVPIALAGATVYSFEPGNMLLVLCVHGSKHRWEKLKWICDVSEFVRVHRDAIDWRELQRKASALRAARMVDLGLRLAQDILGADVPGVMSRRLPADAGVEKLAGKVRAALFESHDRPETSYRRIAFYLATSDSGHQRVLFGLRYISQWLYGLVTPTHVDSDSLPLPRYLSFLYYVYRPMRLAVKYARLTAQRADRPKGVERRVSARSAE